MTITVGIVDDHPLFREGVSRSLSEISDFVVVAEGETSSDALSMASSVRPDVLLLDVSMPGDGLAAIDEVLCRSPQTKILMLTASDDIGALTVAINRGAMGYVLKGVGAKSLADAIRAVANGSRWISPVMSAKLVDHSLTRPPLGANDRLLSTRERQVMELVAEGQSNKLIARHLDLQEKTVKHHMTQIMTKLGVTNRTEAALRWKTML
ncbi:response regulator transcription factor [Rhizobium cauense]|uniref:response regulator n=1 Tax=Rhizobium cauense TaxID=1166683 RepID=UPI001C6ECEF7|nr:response regulator transcription factor [Rhizobium cauense]